MSRPETIKDLPDPFDCFAATDEDIQAVRRDMGLE